MEVRFAQLSFDEQKGSEMGIGMYLLNLYHFGGVGHLTANYEKLLQIGYPGYRKLVEAEKAKLDNSLPVCGALGKKLGPSTGSLKTFDSIEEVLDSYDKQIKYWTDQMVAGIEIMEESHRRLKPTPYLSILIEECIESGKDLTAGGARFNHTGPQANGIGTVADSLSAISQLVFDERRVSGEELLEAVKNNCEGAEALYMLL